LKNKYDALSLLQLLYPLYRDYWDLEEMEWLKYFYNWALKLSFPEKINKEFHPGLDPLVLFYLNILREFSKYEIKYDKGNFPYEFPISLLEEKEERDSIYLKE